jgi:uncharacterized membrane protein YjgN (DUF898 family)
LFWWTLIGLTLGLAYPFAQASLERFKMKRTYYGNLAGRFEGSGWRLFWRGLPMWLLVVGPLFIALIAAIAAVNWGELAGLGGRSGEDAVRRLLTSNPNFIALITTASIALLFSITMVMVLFPVFQAMVMRWWISGLRIGEVEITSHLRTGTIYGAYLRFIGYGLLFALAVGILGAIVALVIGVLGQSFGREFSEIGGTGAAVVFYVILMLGYSTIYQAAVKLTLWREGVETVAIKNIAALDDVRADGVPSSAVGEGLADALNVGGI